jgi:gas vesicle structural protein
VAIAVHPRAGSTSLIDVLDRVLDKGIVIDAWMRVTLAGLDLVEVEARVVVASINTYLAQARDMLGARLVAPPVFTAAKKQRKVLDRPRRLTRGIAAIRAA